MEEFIIPQKVTICLNMIVKNESHIIEKTLEKLCNKIKFDYWVICDTGSTDNTPEIITEFFSKKNIKGEIHYDAWENFAHNRTLALKRAYKKTDLLLVFDADDEIVGDIKIPTDVLFDEYSLKFGSSSGTSYTRVLMINNHKIFEYLSVIHEFITCKEGPTKGTLIEGDYYVVSGRTGSRSFDKDKYLKDALILEKAHAEAVTKKDPLFHRYAFYCANSYKDCGKFEDAVKWYKITLNQQGQWGQEKYISCLCIYECFEKLKQMETGFFYLVKAFAYDNERLECLYHLLVHYCCENMHKVAYNYYLNIKDFFENKYLNTDISTKLFVTLDKYNFFVPYYMIMIADKVKDFDCVVKMYEIIFTKKQRMFEEWYIKNLLYNLQFFLQHVPKDNTQFIPLANEYFKFVFENGIELQKFDFLSNPKYKNAGIIMDNYIVKEVTNKSQKYSKNECANSKNILIYTGFSDIDWNYTYMQNNALGGSEKAVAYLSKCFPKDYNIFISGHVKNERIDNIQYIHLNELTNLIERTPFHTVIVSRYIGFYEMFKMCSFYQSFIWAHDTLLLQYGCNLNETRILKKWNNYIDGCVCLTEWHKTLFSEKYPELKNKITLINNGLELTCFPNVDSKNILKNNKIKNTFIYTSRPDRGLNILLKLWPQIIEKIPDATLTISTYGAFPSNAAEVAMKTLIDSTLSIHYLGKLNVEQLYNEMSTAEFWLYPTHWQETSCITALEMLMSEVICLYYPVAGLVNTIGDYGIQIKAGSEIDAIVSLTIDNKNEIRQKGREYAETCSWSKRYESWNKLLSHNKNTNFDNNIQDRIYELHNIGFIPKNHIDFLKKLSIDFTPKIIYDIGSNVLSWTREAKKMWPTSEIIAFDAIENVEFLYKEHNIKYHIGVLSKEDNSVVRFYENNIHPAGNSYYKEIGHSKSNELYPENMYIEKNTHTLSSVVEKRKFLLPDLIKIDVQGAELDIIMGGLDVINAAKYLIVELQDTQYNKGAPLADRTIKFLENNRWELVAPKFCDNGPDADYCFKNMRYHDGKNIAIFNSFPFHYEMFGYIIDYCKKHKYKLTIFTNTDNSLGWLEFYNTHFSSNVFDFEYKTINDFENFKNTFDLIFVTTDDDYAFKTEWINERCISINHHYTIRRPEYKHNLATRLFIDNIRDWAMPCYQILNIYDKQNMFESDINIAIIGSYNGLKSNIINRLESNNKIKLHICGRVSNNIDVNPNITVKHYLKIDTMELICLLKKCDYILTDCSNNDDHIKGYGLSGAIPLAFSTLVPLIISKTNNNKYKFKNVIEFDLETNDKIIIEKEKINIDLLVEEREEFVSMLPEWLNKKKLLDNNIFYFEHDDVHVRLLQNEGNKTIYQHFSNRSNTEIMFRKLVSYIMPNFIDKNIIDLGAYIGDNAIPWALKMRGTIYAIDPSKANISFITKMASLNNVNNIVTIETAVSDKNETIYCNETDTTHISCNTSSGIHSFNAVSLDSLNLENIGFIHLDVEGFEQKILYGAINIITKYNPIIAWENHIEKEDYMKVVDFFCCHKYTTYMINEQFPHCFPDCRNFISFPENCNISVNEINNKFKEIYKNFTSDKKNPLLISIKSHISFDIPNKNIIKLDSKNIPKKIFQTWETTDIEPEFQQIIDKWKYHNPTYEYIFHNAEQRVEFIRNNFEKNVLNAYKKIIPGAYKCDLWRYCVLYIYGGFYADIDTLCMGKLNSLTNENIEFIVPIDLNINEKEGQHNLACGFIGSVPKSSILLDAIERIVFNVENNIIPTSKLDFSGPGLLGRAVNKFLNLDEITSFKGKEGIRNNINFLEFDPTTEYMQDVHTDTIILQNKNKNYDIIRLYNNECNKIKNYTCWLSNNIIKMM